MTDVKTRTVWRTVDAHWVDEDPAVSVMVVVLQSAGKEYVVAISGPKGMKADEFVPACTAAGHMLNAACVGVIAESGPSDSTFDTGNQRAN